jgi:cell wall assembly regulator SMI1
MNNQLSEWLEAHLPETLKGLHQGADESQLLNIENVIGLRLPDALREFYRLHNGQHDGPGLFYGLMFLSLEQVQQHWEYLSNQTDGVSEAEISDLSTLCSSHPEGRIKPLFANPRWIPFAYDFGGNYLGLDFDPDISGTPGQVINFGRDEDAKYVLAESFPAFIEWYVSQLVSGNFEIRQEDEDGKSFNTLHPSSSHFFDALKTLFSTHSPNKENLEQDASSHKQTAPSVSATKTPWELFEEVKGLIETTMLDTLPKGWDELELAFSNELDGGSLDCCLLSAERADSLPLTHSSTPTLLQSARDLATATANDLATSGETPLWSRCRITYT